MLAFARRQYNGFKYAVNGNRHTLGLNRMYRRYHAYCRSRAALTLEPAALAAAKVFRRDGYFVFPGALKDVAAIGERVDRLFGNADNTIEMSKGTYRLIDGIEQVPEVIAALSPLVISTIEAFYQSHFKVFAAPFYRIVPNLDADESSFLWHIDNCPREELKLMVHLNDVSEETGAFRLKPRPLSSSLVKQGFWDRNTMHKFASVLTDMQSTKVFEQKAGDAVLFMNSGCIHKATSPRKGYRDVVNFVIIPSDIPWREHFARNKHFLSTNAGICIDPFRDRPESISYRL